MRRFPFVMLLPALLVLVAPLAEPAFASQSYPPEVQQRVWWELTTFSTPDAPTNSVFGRAQQPRGRPRVVRWHYGTPDHAWESLTVEYDELGRLAGWLKSGELVTTSGGSAERDDEGRIVVTRMDWSTTKTPSSGYHWSYGSHGCPVSAKMLVDGEWKELIRFEYEDGRVRRRLERKDKSWRTQGDYVHDADGRLVQMIWYVHGSTVRRHFDYEGQNVRRITCAVNRTTVEIVDFERDDSGRLRLERVTRLSGPRGGVESKLWSEAGTLVLERFCKGDALKMGGGERALLPCSTPGSTATYYADGDALHSVFIEPDGSERRIDYALEFDEHGNWIRSTPVDSRPPPGSDDLDIIWREIEYYE